MEAAKQTAVLRNRTRHLVWPIKQSPAWHSEKRSRPHGLINRHQVWRLHIAQIAKKNCNNCRRNPINQLQSWVELRGVVQFAIFGNYRHKMTSAGFKVGKESKDIDTFWYQFCKKMCYVVGRNVQKIGLVGKGPLLIILQAFAPWGPMGLLSCKTNSKYMPWDFQEEALLMLSG